MSHGSCKSYATRDHGLFITKSLPDDGFVFQIAADTLVLERNGTFAHRPLFTCARLQFRE